MTEARIRGIADRLERLEADGVAHGPNDLRNTVHEARLAVFLILAKSARTEWQGEALAVLDKLRPGLADALRRLIQAREACPVIDTAAVGAAVQPFLPLAEDELQHIKNHEARGFARWRAENRFGLPGSASPNARHGFTQAHFASRVRLH